MEGKSPKRTFPKGVVLWALPQASAKQIPETDKLSSRTLTFGEKLPLLDTWGPRLNLYRNIHIKLEVL